MYIRRSNGGRKLCGKRSTGCFKCYWTGLVSFYSKTSIQYRSFHSAFITCVVIPPTFTAGIKQLANACQAARSLSTILQSARQVAQKEKQVISRSRRILGPFSLQSVGAAEADSLALGHNPGRVATPTLDTSMVALILPTSFGWQAEFTPLGINSTAERDLNSGPSYPKPTTRTIVPTPGIVIWRCFIVFAKMAAIVIIIDIDICRLHDDHFHGIGSHGTFIQYCVCLNIYEVQTNIRIWVVKGQCRQSWFERTEKTWNWMYF